MDAAVTTTTEKIAQGSILKLKYLQRYLFLWTMMKNRKSSTGWISKDSNKRCCFTLPPWILQDSWVKTNMQVINFVDAWKHSDFLCRNYVMNGLHDSLYNVYCAFKTAKELWESLDQKYKTEDAGAKKIVVDWFLEFKMVDSKIVVSQVQEIQVILHEIHVEGMILSETFQVAIIFEKLPPG